MARSRALALFFLGSLSCTHELAQPVDLPSASVRAAEARWREATTIARVRIIENTALTYDEGRCRTGICGHRERAETIAILDGVALQGTFLSNEPLEEGEEYLVALLGFREPLGPADYAGMSERGAAFLRCRDQLRQHTLGTARIMRIDGDERVVASSDLVPREVLGTTVDGNVRLSDVLDVGFRVRATK